MNVMSEKQRVAVLRALSHVVTNATKAALDELGRSIDEGERAVSRIDGHEVATITRTRATRKAYVASDAEFLLWTQDNKPDAVYESIELTPFAKKEALKAALEKAIMEGDERSLMRRTGVDEDFQRQVLADVEAGLLEPVEDVQGVAVATKDGYLQVRQTPEQVEAIADQWRTGKLSVAQAIGGTL